MGVLEEDGFSSLFLVPDVSEAHGLSGRREGALRDDSGGTANGEHDLGSCLC